VSDITPERCCSCRSLRRFVIVHSLFTDTRSQPPWAARGGRRERRRNSELDNMHLLDVHRPSRAEQSRFKRNPCDLFLASFSLFLLPSVPSRNIYMYLCTVHSSAASLIASVSCTATRLYSPYLGMSIGPSNFSSTGSFLDGVISGKLVYDNTRKAGKSTRRLRGASGQSHADFNQIQRSMRGDRRSIGGGRRGHVSGLWRGL